MNNDLVTLIIPIYHDEEYVERCILSAMNQTYKNLEIIVVNDGSDDNSPMIAEKLKKQDDRIIIINKENGGLSSARNAALDVFKGDYVYFLDADDYLYHTSIEYLLKIAKDSDVDIVYSLTNRNNQNPMVLDSEITYKNKEEAIESYLKGENFSESCCAKLFKREIFDTLRFDFGKIYEDAFITYRILNITNNIAITRFNGYIGTNRPSSITHAKYSNKNYDMVEANRNIYYFYKGTKYEKAAYNKYIGAMMYFILTTNGDNSITKNKTARDELKKELKENGIFSLKPRLFILSLFGITGLIKILKINR